MAMEGRIVGRRSFGKTCAEQGRADAVPTRSPSRLTVLVATWRDGLFVVAGETLYQELGSQSIRALTPDGHGGALAVVNERSLRRRTPDGLWSTIATTEFDLACCVPVGDVIYVGTEDARVLRVGADGAVEQLRGFDAVAGRETSGAVNDIETPRVQ